MKYLYIVLIVLLLMPMVLAVESQVEVNADVYFEVINNKGNLRLVFEGYDPIYRPSLMLSYDIRYTETIDNSTNETIVIWNASKVGSNELLSTTATKVGFTMVKEFGNSSELFDIINTCNDMANFSNLWELCINQRTNFELRIANDMVNKTYFNEIENNLTTKFTNLETEYNNYKTTKESEITEKDERIVELEKHRQWGWGIGIIGIGTSIYFLNKYRGFGKRKQQVETEFPKDVAV